ncbi:MAG: hypothetical protein FIA95_09165, partial [Gemmatimonadetes bacterium]|nr:hypothetical protein [Gemmatimonadota bacterium]
MTTRRSGGSRLVSFAAELKRRHVWRVAAVYVVVALAVIAAASDILPRLLLPDWTVTLVIVLAILGLPLALVLAWGYDITRDGIVRTEAVQDVSAETSGTPAAASAAASSTALPAAHPPQPPTRQNLAE